MATWSRNRDSDWAKNGGGRKRRSLLSPAPNETLACSPGGSPLLALLLFQASKRRLATVRAGTKPFRPTERAADPPCMAYTMPAQPPQFLEVAQPGEIPSAKKRLRRKCQMRKWRVLQFPSFLSSILGRPNSSTVSVCTETVYRISQSNIGQLSNS